MKTLVMFWVGDSEFAARSGLECVPRLEEDVFFVSHPKRYFTVEQVQHHFYQPTDPHAFDGAEHVINISLKEWK